MRAFLLCAAMLCGALSVTSMHTSAQLAGPCAYPNVAFFPAAIDHFDTVSPAGRATFAQKVLWCDAYWDGENGPVLFYTGNESPVEAFYNNTGIMFEWAAQLNALVVFVEHRYYGSSLPFGADSFTPTNLQYLTIQQALEDYAQVIDAIQTKEVPATAHVPWFAIGGSYGGVLAAFFRTRYPHLIAGAIAASAPIKFLDPTGAIDWSYFAVATQDYHDNAPQCADTVRAGFSALQALASAGEYTTIQETWRLCAVPTADTMEHLRLWAGQALVMIAQFDYPVPSSFGGSPLPAYPLNATCGILTDQSLTPLQALGQAVGLFYNGTSGELTCFDPSYEFLQCADLTGCGHGPGSTAWDYQSCTQFIFLPNTNSTSDMFPSYRFDLADLTAYCQRKYGVTPDPSILARDFGAGPDGHILQSATNIIFSNGLTDPFHAGSFLPTDREPANPTNVRLLYAGAHHLDLRGSNPTTDPADVIAVRAAELSLLQRWTRDFVGATIARE